MQPYGIVEEPLEDMMALENIGGMMLSLNLVRKYHCTRPSENQTMSPHMYSDYAIIKQGS